MKVGDLVCVKIYKGTEMGIIVSNPKPCQLRGGRMSVEVLMFRNWKVDGWAVTVIEVIK